ncbi:MAG: methylmalonyl-CoA epimerase [Chloroflexi bacterium]|uniref:Methylmalonyl-CoA epimerase n=1 Tax=Candidatus Chlorohelix allophototropha TaxID=3003348 RepID=A0A8T7LV23_9CHLR|nr:methylmalonyl-CoA epimerase [Chloroflexota bacterium]WJW66609.1 methylmalonyl-CoA epimerase [Chloroflexota bacterium L227-S17]
MAINKIDHIGIAVKDLTSSLKFYEEALGLENIGFEVVEEQGVRVAFLTVGESKIELLEPLNEESPIAKFIAKRGEGIHHICLDVEDVPEALGELKERNLQLIDQQPRRGAHHKDIAFVHPKSSSGVLIELSMDGKD